MKKARGSRQGSRELQASDVCMVNAVFTHVNVRIGRNLPKLCRSCGAPAQSRLTIRLPGGGTSPVSPRGEVVRSSCSSRAERRPRRRPRRWPLDDGLPGCTRTSATGTVRPAANILKRLLCGSPARSPWKGPGIAPRNPVAPGGSTAGDLAPAEELAGAKQIQRGSMASLRAEGQKTTRGEKRNDPPHHLRGTP